MVSSLPIRYLKDTFKEEDWPWIIPSLRQDSLIWKTLNNLEFLKQAIIELGNKPKNWSPINIALVFLGETNHLGERTESTNLHFSKVLIQNSISTFETQTSKNPLEMNLGLAGLLSIYLYENPDVPKPIEWKTSLSCLYGIVSNPIEFVSQLAFPTAVHVVLAQPLTVAEQKEIFLNILPQNDINHCLSFLNELSFQRSDISELIAREIFDHVPAEIIVTERTDIDHSFQNIGNLITNASVHSFLNNQNEKIQFTLDAYSEVEKLRSDIAIQIIVSRIKHQQIKEANHFWDFYKENFTSNQIAQLILALDKTDSIKKILHWFDEEVISQLGTEIIDPVRNLAYSIILYHQGKDNLVYKFAHAALVGFNNSNVKPPSYLYQLANLFFITNKPNESILVTNWVIDQQPNNTEAILLLMKSYQLRRENKLVIETAHLAVALEPQNIELRRFLAELLENDNQWSQALKEREAIIKFQQNPDKLDFHFLAACALRIDQPQRTAAICQQLLNDNPEDSEAHRLLGNAFIALGDIQSGQTHLEQAIQISPNSAKSWIDLANLYQIMEQKGKKREILLSASNTIPNDPEIQFELGKVYYNDSAFTQALHSFQSAYQSASESDRTINIELISGIAEYLGNTFLHLGHTSEALKVLHDAYEMDPDHVGISHVYAKSLLSEGYPDKAIVVLTHVKDKAAENCDICLDFAKASILTHKELDSAKDCLLNILKANHDLNEAKALLAEIYELTEEYSLALNSYQEVANTQIHDDPNWNYRISLGIGRTSLQLHQPEIAIEALKNALIFKGDDQDILKILSSAYQASDLKDKAFVIASRVLEIAPENDNNIDWFIQQAISLDATNKAIVVLKEALKISPDKSSLFTNLGWLYLYEGDADAAWNNFNQVKMMNHTGPGNLYKASQGFLAINDSNSAIECINKVISMCENTAEQFPLDEYYLTKATAQQMNGNLNEALETLEESISKYPINPEIIEKKSKILFDLNQKEEAIACLENGIDIFPENEKIIIQTINLKRSRGDLKAAVELAYSSFHITENPESWSIKASTSATIAELADSILQKSLANEIIENAIVNNDQPIPDDLAYHCLKAKLAFDNEEDISAANSITSALKIDPNNPRVLALQARLSSRQGDLETAKQFLQHALKAVGGYQILTSTKINFDRLINLAAVEQPASIFMELADICLLFRQWSAAIFLYQKTIEASPNEPRSYFAYSRGLVLRAEYQRICQELNILTNSPGPAAIEEFSYLQFEDAIIKAGHLVTKNNPIEDNISSRNSEPRAMIASWLARGRAIFQPSLEHAEILANLQKTPENQAAHIAALRYCNELSNAIKVSKNIYQKISDDLSYPFLLGQIALTISKESPEVANEAIQTAIKLSNWFSMPDRPIYYAIQAEIANQNDDPILNYESIQSALSIWPNEPIWLETAADFLLTKSNNDDISQATKYLEQATILQPKNVNRYLKLARVYERVECPQDSIRVLERATNLFPKQSDLWIALASAYHRNGDIAQAIRCAKTVVKINPTKTDASLLLAQIALDVDNPQKAFKYLDDVLNKEHENMQALVLRSKTFKALNKPREALNALEFAIQNIPKSIPIQLERISLIRQTQGEEKAFEALKQLNDEEPNNPKILSYLAESFFINGEQEAAIQTAQDALSIGRGSLDNEELVNLLHLLGRLLKKSGQLDQAIHHLSEAVELSPNNPRSYLDLGRCYQEQRQYKRALNHFQKTIGLSHECHQAYYFAGLIYKDIKDYVNAEMMFKKAADLAPNDLNIHRQLGAVTAINLVHNRQEESV